MRTKTLFEVRNAQEWNEVLNQIFPEGLPDSATWTEKPAILRVLNQLGGVKNLNHTLFPDGGGLDLTGAVTSNEKGCIELRFDSFNHVARPEKLVFENVGNDPAWCYFRLEANDLKPSGLNATVLNKHEYVCELEDGTYLNANAHEQIDFDNNPIYPGSRIVCRYLGGRFLIVQKTSEYNGIPKTYDGRHSDMSASEFKEYMEQFYSSLRELENEEK